MKRFISVLLVIALLVPMLCVDVFAADHQVKDFDELKAAIASAASGDVITVASNITLDETLAIENKNITIKGTSALAILAKNALTNNVEVKNTMFVIRNSKVKFDGLTLGGNKMNRIIYSEKSDIELNKASINDGCPGDNSNINPGGGIFLRGGSLTATDTVFSNNKPGSATGLPQGDGDLNGGAIYSGSTKADIKITGGSFVDNEVKAYGHGAAIYQENGTLNVTGTSFKNNKGHVEGGNAGTQGACIHTRDKVKATISGVTAEIAKGFNTGGFLRSWKSNITVTGSTFTIAGLGDGYGYSGGALCFEGGTSKVTGSTFTCTGSKLYHAGGFIDIVGTGTHVIDVNTMTGAGKDNGQQIASFGGAISVEEGASATVTIKNNTIKDSSASDNGGAIAIGTHKGKSTPSTVTMSGNTISNAGTLFWGAQYGGGVFVAPDATVTMTKDTIKDTRSSYGGGIYNEGNLTITGGSSLTGGVGSKLGGEIYNNGELTVDDATITGNFVGGAAWEQYASHGKNFELGGTNIYAEKSVTITPKANIKTGKDVRVLDGQSKIRLTGALTKEIDVSVSETPGGNETQKRRVGYVVAEGTKGYEVTKSDANFLHYIGRTNKKDASHYSNQPRAAYADDKSTGEWDFVLDKDNKKVVLGQRVKLIYHGNLGKLGTNDKEEKTVDVYKNPNFWENQLEEYKVADPKLEGSSFMGWYFWKDGEKAGDEDDSIQNIKIPDNLRENLFDFSKVKFENNVKDTDKIITPNIIHTYAGWSENISIPVLKDWGDTEEADKVDVTVTLRGGEKDITLTLTKAGNYFDQFEDLKVFTKSYQPNEEKNMNLKFTPKTYSVVETPIAGFTTSYSPQSMIANQVAEVSRFVVTNKKTFKVTYEFKSGTEGKTLPAAIEGYKPTDDTEYADKATVTAKAPTQTTYEDTENNGTWTFTSWDANSKTIDKADVKFVGTWTFAAKPETKYKATYEFKSGTDGKTLPAAIEGYKPTDDAEYADGATVNAKQPIQTSYEDTENNGTWTFNSWDANSKTINKADVKFIGTWTFAAKPEPTSDFSITKSVDKATYEKAGEELTYTITVTNTGEANLTGLTISDSLVKLDVKPFDLDKGKSKTFTYSYTITEDDVKLESVINVASVTHGKTTKTDEAKSILKEKEKRGDVYVRYETEDGKILDEFAVLIDAPVGTYYYTEEKAFPRYRFVGLAPYSDPAEGYVVEGTQYVVYLYRRDRGERTPDRRDRYEREEKEVEEPIVEAKRKPELNKKDHKQYMYGYPDWTFVPAANITRGEAAAMFARLFKEYPGLDYNYKKYYTDVDESYWGFKEVAYLSEFGILSGYSDGTFRPNNKITRAEFVKIAESFEALTWGLSPYNDVDGGHWAFRYIVSSAAKGWISGYPDGSFRPNSLISRAEAVTIVNRLLERRPDKDYIDTHKPELKPFTDLKPSYWAYYEIYEAVDGHDYNRSFTDIEEHWYRLNNERFVFSQPRYYR
ncbi:SHIRT domain-containing protein [Fenollaria timonensis]|uniref:SHIRT domain-containing protein n=1 Tax=Fenollaria timonensis TaxID=1723384 RepID=UPI0026E9D672|nr:SHIRT domain-containing protein [Fenollaria timonensis]